MAIKVQCGGCGVSINAKDELAGKRVKCPKCAKPLVIPGPVATRPAKSKQQVAAGRAAAARSIAPPNAHNPLLDLLDEAGVESMTRGPACENCGAEMHPSAVVCVSCGFNMATGKKLETAVFRDDDSELDFGMTDTDRILAKAEQDIEDSPITAQGQDFGDGADSLLIAGVAVVFFAVLLAIGLAAVLLMDQITDYISSAEISYYASILVSLVCITWISIVAFMSNTTQGIICIATGGLYCVIFGFMQGKALLMPTIMLIISTLIGLVCYAYINGGNGGDEYSQLLTQCLALIC